MEERIMNKNQKFEKLKDKVKNLVNSDNNSNETLQQVCDLLKEEISYYDWVGFYLVREDQKLELGPFAGDPTEHTEIDFGQGICGQAAETKENFVVQDVTKESNYLSCSPKVKSEIVIPIFENNKIIGEIDIDSHSISPFSEGDEIFLEEISDLISTII